MDYLDTTPPQGSVARGKSHTRQIQGVHMQKKSGKFMADWRDTKGQRHRKAFPTRQAAITHSTKMRQQRDALASRPQARQRNSARR